MLLRWCRGDNWSLRFAASRRVSGDPTKVFTKVERHQVSEGLKPNESRSQVMSVRFCRPKHSSFAWINWFKWRLRYYHQRFSSLILVMLLLRVLDLSTTASSLSRRPTFQKETRWRKLSQRGKGWKKKGNRSCLPVDVYLERFLAGLLSVFFPPLLASFYFLSIVDHGAASDHPRTMQEKAVTRCSKVL